MIAPEDELMDRSGVNCDGQEWTPCRNCEHIHHANEECREKVQQQFFCGWETCECGCTDYEPLTAEDILEAEHPEEI